MPIVFTEDKEVTVSPETGGLEVPGPIPSSMQNEAQALFNEASAEIQKDFPDIKFGKPEKVPKKFTVGGPVAVEGAPAKFTIGGKPALPEPPAPPESPESGSSWAILGEHLAGGFERLVKKTPESFKLRNIDQPQDTSIDRALSKYLGDKSPEFLAVRRKALKYTPEERKAAVEKQQQILKGIDDEISKGQIQPDGKWQEWVASAGDSLGFMAPTLALGLLTGPAGALAAIGTATYAESYANHRANGATPENAQGLAAIDGWTEALTELFPVMRLFKTKGLIKKFVAEVIADIPGEWVANAVQSATEAISKLGKNPTKEQVAEAIQTSLKETTPVSAKGVESMADTAAVTVLAGGALAGAATGIEQGKALLTREPPVAPPPGGAPPPATGSPSGAPQGPPTPQLQTPPPPPGPPPGGPGGGPPAAPVAGGVAIYKPEPNQPGAAVLIQGIDPQSGQAQLVRLDPQTGEPVTLPDGEPATFVAPVDQLILSQQPPAAPQPSQVPPSQTTTEPTLDIAGQIKDMHNGASARRGVYLSPDTIQKMQQEGTYQKAVASGVIAENFDGQGGTLIVRSKKDLQEAMAARDQGQTDMQAIIGSLTGAGVAKPNVPNPAVIQRRDETGAVVQQTMVPQAEAPATAAVVNQQPGNVSVTTPDAAIAEREAKVALEQAPPNRLAAIVPPPAPVAPVETGPKVGPVTQAQQAVDMAIATLRRPKGPGSRIPDIRAAAQDLIAAGMVLRAAVAHAAARGAPDSLIVQGNQAAERAEFLSTKTEADYKKSKGVSAKIVAERLLAVQDAVVALKPFENAPKQAPAPKKETKAEKAKKVSKKKEAKAEPESKAPADELVTKVLETPEMRENVRRISDELRERLLAAPDGQVEPLKVPEELVTERTPGEQENEPVQVPTSNVSNKFDEKLARKESAEESALIQDSWKREANARIKKVKSLLEKLDGFKTQPSVNVNMIEGRQARLDKFLGQMDAAFEEGDVGRFNAAAQNAEVIAKEMVALMQEQPAPDNVVSAVGITVVPPGPTRKKKRTKYVPPAKAEGPKVATAEDIEKLAKVAEKALPSKPKPKVVELAPANVVGTEGEFINDLLGTTDAEITAEIANDTTGRLAAVLQEIVNAIGNRGDWTGWFAASVRGDVIGDKKNALMGAIRKYAAADTRGLNEAREEILGIVTNLEYEGTEGWSLPLEAIGAIMEAANISRAYTMMRQEMYDAGSAEANTTYDPETNELIDNRPIRDLAEDVTTESQFDTTMLGTPATKDTNATQGTMSNVAENTIQTSIRRKGRKYEKPGPVPKSLINRLWGSVFNYYGTSAMFAVWHEGISKDKALIRKIGEAHFNKSYLSSKEFLKDLMRHLPEPTTALNNKERVFRQFLTSLYEAMPDVPVEFIRWDGRPVDWYGRRRSGFASGMFFGDSANIQIMLPRRGLDVGAVETIVHEMIHSATLYELIRNPNGPMNQTLERLRLEIVERAKAKYGRSFTEAYNSMLQDRDNMSQHTKHWKNYIYGLTDTAELSAEILNPYFQEFLASLDQTPTRSWFRGLINKFIRAFNKYVRHSSDPRANQLLNEIMAATYRTMRAQAGRAARLVKARDLITQNLAEMLNIPMERAVAITTLFSTHVSPYQIGGLQKIDPELVSGERSLAQNIIGFEWDNLRGANTYGDEQRGYDLQADDQLLLRAYGLPVEVLGRDLIKNRQIYGPIMKAVDKERTSRAGPPRLKDHEKLRILTGPRTVSSLGMVRRMMGSGVIGELREKARGFNSTDFLIRRGARFFGTTMDALNPLIAWKQIRDSRRMYANQLMELAEKTVNSLWTKLTSAESAQLGDMLQQTTTWQIDPEGGPNQTKLIRTMSNKNWNRKRLEIEAKWNALSENQKDIYRSVQKYFQTEYAKIRRAAVDLAVDSYAQGLSQAQRTALYTVKKVEDIEKVIGPNRVIDLGDGNTQFAKVMKSLVKTTTIKGPYFPLMRKGSWVVEANREGILTDPYTDEPQVFDNEEDAKAAADDIKSRAPKNKAKARNDGNGWIVEYKAHFISFNSSKNEALEEIAQLKSEGLQVSVATRKLEEVRSENLSQGLTELMARARQVAQGSSRTEGTEELLVTLETAFTQILAEKAASAQQQLKRQGFEGFKGKEAHETFTRRTRSSSWHYANLKTALASAKALSEIRKFSKNPELGQTAVRDLQVIADQRGRTMIEIIRRLRVEAAESADVGDHNLDAIMGQAGFLNFLASPSYSFINTMQNFNVAMPVIYAEYGPRGARSFLSAMKLVGGPAFAKAMRGMFNKPGQVTSYDVYTAIVEAVKDHPRFGRFTRPGPDGAPSPLQQLVDRNVINASYVQELAAVANNQNLQVTKGLEYIRLFPQGAELFNRISTALAVLEMENGKVDPAADMIDRVHLNYSLENRPRFFRQLGKVRLPQALTMFKMYGVGMYQLGASLVVDAAAGGRRGLTRQQRLNSAKALAGIIAAHTLSAGIIGGLMIEPLRLLREVWNALRGDDDEFGDLDTMIHNWAADVIENETARRMLTNGIWTGLGFDLSSRMGLDRMVLFNPLDFTSAAAFKSSAFSAIAGPMQTVFIDNMFRASDLIDRGQYMKALGTIIPLKVLHDAMKAYELVNKGLTTKDGKEVMPAEKFGYLDMVGRAAGFRTVEESMDTAKSSTRYGYRNWKTARSKELVREYLLAYNEGDAAAMAKATTAIEKFNDKNPLDPITYKSITGAALGQEWAALERQGISRRPAETELTDW